MSSRLSSRLCNMPLRGVRLRTGPRRRGGRSVLSPRPPPAVYLSATRVICPTDAVSPACHASSPSRCTSGPLGGPPPPAFRVPHADGRVPHVREARRARDRSALTRPPAEKVTHSGAGGASAVSGHWCICTVSVRGLPPARLWRATPAAAPCSCPFTRRGVARPRP